MQIINYTKGGDRVILCATNFSNSNRVNTQITYTRKRCPSLRAVARKSGIWSQSLPVFDTCSGTTVKARFEELFSEIIRIFRGFRIFSYFVFNFMQILKNLMTILGGDSNTQRPEIYIIMHVRTYFNDIFMQHCR